MQNRLFKELKYKISRKFSISARRKFLSEHLDLKFSGTVRYGPFKGLKLTRNSWWGEKDRGAMLLGLYEKEVLESLFAIDKKYNVFIDVGAADGYYAIGVLTSNLFRKSYCFELSTKGQKTILENAITNHVEDRVVINGRAAEKFYNAIPDSEISHSVLFFDIEGSEFDLIDDQLLNKFRNSIIFIELHEWGIADGEQKLEILRTKILRLFRITELTTAGRDLSVFPELTEMNDTDRWLICSEGRARRMIWWRLDPLDV